MRLGIRFRRNGSGCHVKSHELDIAALPLILDLVASEVVGMPFPSSERRGVRVSAGYGLLRSDT